jgi:uncharacterized phage-associated protein
MRQPVKASCSLHLNPTDIAKYFLAMTFEDGELITNLKMQKIVYYAYAWALAKDGTRLFDERIEAWVNGPVVRSLYQDLKPFGSGPIAEAWLLENGTFDVEGFMEKLTPQVKETLREVYEKYMTMTAFELVQITHSEAPWRNAREGLGPSDQSGKPIDDNDIIAEYGNRH